MEFKDFLQFVNEAESTAEKDDKAEKAGKKVAKDIEYDEGHKGKDDAKAEKAGKEVKKDIEYDDKKDKKSLKDWFEIIDKNMLAEAEQLTIEPAKQNTQVIKQGTKTLGTVTNPALAANIKAAIGKGEMSLAGKEMKEADAVEEKAKNPYAIGMAQAIKSTGDKPPLKKSTIVKAHDIAKKVMKKEAAEDNPDSAMLEADVEESGLQAYLGKKKYGKEGMAALQKAGREGASKEKMAQIRAKHDKLDEVDQPTMDNMSAKGAGLGAGRSDKVLEAKPDFIDLDKDGNKKESMKKAAADKKKKKVDETMDKCKAAYHEGKSHGLSKHGYACRYEHGSPEHQHYHKGFKEGLDECYGQMPVQGLVVSETDPVPATVPGMASQAMPAAMEDDMGEGNAFTGKLASTPKGGSFELDGKKFKDTSSLEEFAFESLDKQLSELLSEGISVNMQKDIGAMGDDSVSVTATADDAGKLLDFIKQVGLGGLSDASAEVAAEPVAVSVSDYGAPKFSGHDDMKSLIGKVTGDDYKDEEGQDDAPKMKMCGVHSLPEGECGCGEGKEVVDEVETEDQMAYEVAEDDGEGYEQSQADAGKIDSALALSGASKGGATNEDGAEAPGSNPVGQAEQEEAEEVNEEEKEGEKLDEWANDAGMKGTDASFERDIEFMTKVIAGGLNKPKSTGQTTIPVIAGQKDRMGVDEDIIAEWKKLSGI
jgi:hypothetical protein